MVGVPWFISFHGLFNVRIFSDSAIYETLLRHEFSNFIVDTLPHEPDLDLILAPFDKASLGKWSPFFNFEYAADAVFSRKRYKTAVWELALTHLKSTTPKLYFHGNLSATRFFIGEILEPLMRMRLASKGTLFLHSSCVATSLAGCLVSGIRHTGKTFVMLKAVLSGAAFLSDDYTFVGADGELYAYPKRVNLFTSHFREIEELAPFWRTLPCRDRASMRIFSIIRSLTRDYVVLGYQRYLPEFIPSITLQERAPLKKILILTARPYAPFELKESISSEDAATKIAANNAWEGQYWQSLLHAYRYGNRGDLPSSWLIEETALIKTMARGVAASEIFVPDFSQETIRRYSQAIRQVLCL